MTSLMTEPGLQINWLHFINFVLLLCLLNKYKFIDYLIKTHTIPINPNMEGYLKKNLLKKGFLLTMFLSSFENKLDKKGRVSVPANFRSHLNSLGYNGFISYPSFNHPALEACSQDRIEKLSNTIDTLNPFEEKRDYFATSVLSESENLQFDTEGRVSISEKLLNHAKIKNNILFVGLGKTFQIWEPKNFEKFKSFARKKAFQNRSNLKWDNKQKGEL